MSYYTEDQINQCCTLGEVKQYNPNDVIYGVDKGRLNSVFFVIRGNCTILQTLKMMSTNVNNNKQYYLTEAEELDSPARILLEKLHSVADKKRKFSTFCGEDVEGNKIRPEALRTARKSSFGIPMEKDNFHIPTVIEDMQSEIKFVHIGTFSPGSVFGLGEEMIDRTIVARNSVQCLQIPRYLLFQKTQNLGNIWQRLKMYLNSSIPSRHQLFQDFIRTRKWNKFKDNIVDEIFNLKPPSNTTRISDVPILCRVDAGL